MLLPQSKNLFDNIAALAPPKQTKVADELAADPAACPQWDVLKFDPRTSVPQRLEQTGPDRE